MAGTNLDFESFFRATYPRLVGELSLLTLSHAEAQDVVQDAFAKALLRWPKVGNFDAPSAWVRRVAINEAIRRWHRDRRLVFKAEVDDRPQREEFWDDLLDLRAALHDLPIKQRVALVLYYSDGMRTEEIARLLRTRPGTVKSWLSRGKQRLRVILEEPRVTEGYSPDVRP